MTHSPESIVIWGQASELVRISGHNRLASFTLVKKSIHSGLGVALSTQGFTPMCLLTCRKDRAEAFDGRLQAAILNLSQSSIDIKLLESSYGVLDEFTHFASAIPGSSSALKVPDGLLVGSGVCIADASIQPQAEYDGGLGGTEIRLRIGNGGAGQSGLIGAWADAFIQYCYKQGIAPFKVGWYLGDTTESLGYLAAGEIDIAVTYNAAAEKQACKSGSAVERVYGFRDHFYLVGPTSDPANLADHAGDVLAMFAQIVDQGNKDLVTPPTDRDPARFLSRFDKSATNIKESELFIAIGQVPWALAYSKWYHQYPRFPLQSLNAASVLSEYTLTDKGTWLSSPTSVTSTLTIFAEGGDTDPDDPLLNPAHVLLGAKANTANEEIWNGFMKWVVAADGGQLVIKEFKKPPGVGGVQLYSPAPEDEE
ncbi:hypothetical protein HD554DRAFT_2312053 [Boletus coccyginus]|nr:hypothetical protein HD554DRAFT_2312053 [Boletus coccyginus]